MTELLSGIRVLDFTWAWAGPHCTALLGDLGAEVIRIESATRVDLQRVVSPFFPDVPSPESGGWQAMHNRRKLGCSINLKTKEGVDLVRRLAAKSDIVVENFRPGVLESLGLAFDDLVELSPNLIYVSLYGYGPGGELANCGAFGAHLAWASGFNLASDPPVVCSIPYSDPLSGTFAAIAAMYGLLARDAGLGPQHFEISQFDCLLFNLDELVPEVADTIRTKTVQIAGQDEWVVLQWEEKKIAQLVKDRLPALQGAINAADPDLDVVAKVLSGLGRDVAVRLLDMYNITYEVVADARDVMNRDNLLDRRYFKLAANKPIGTYLTHGNAVVSSQDNPNEVIKGSPVLGEDTNEVLQQILGLTPGVIQELRAAGVLR